MDAVALTGMTGEAARLTAEAMLRNLTTAERVDALASSRLQHPAGFILSRSRPWKGLLLVGGDGSNQPEGARDQNDSQAEKDGRGIQSIAR